MSEGNFTPDARTAAGPAFNFADALIVVDLFSLLLVGREAERWPQRPDWQPLGGGR